MASNPFLLDMLSVISWAGGACSQWPPGTLHLAAAASGWGMAFCVFVMVLLHGGWGGLCNKERRPIARWLSPGRAPVLWQQSAELPLFALRLLCFRWVGVGAQGLCPITKNLWLFAFITPIFIMWLAERKSPGLWLRKVEVGNCEHWSVPFGQTQASPCFMDWKELRFRCFDEVLHVKIWDCLLESLRFGNK